MVLRVLDDRLLLDEQSRSGVSDHFVFLLVITTTTTTTNTTATSISPITFCDGFDILPVFRPCQMFFELF